MFTLQLATVLGPTSYQLYNFGNATSEHCLQQTTVSIEHRVCGHADTIAWCTTMSTSSLGNSMVTQSSNVQPVAERNKNKRNECVSTGDVSN